MHQEFSNEVYFKYTEPLFEMNLMHLYFFSDTEVDFQNLSIYCQTHKLRSILEIYFLN